MMDARDNFNRIKRLEEIDAIKNEIGAMLNQLDRKITAVEAMMADAVLTDAEKLQEVTDAQYLLTGRAALDGQGSVVGLDTLHARVNTILQLP